MDRYHSPFPLPDEHMRMLGIIATQWEWVEQLLGNAIAEIMEHKPDRVAILTANVGFHQKCDILKAYARTFQEDDPPAWSRFNQTITMLKDAYSARNRFIHAKWQLLDGQMRRTEVRTHGGKFTIANDPTPISELNAAAQQIVDAAEAFIAFVQPYGILCPSGPLPAPTPSGGSG